MSELETKISNLLERQSPATFEQWVNSHDENERDAILQALDYGYRTKSYADLYRVIHNLNENPWQGGIDAMRNYATRTLGA